MWDIIYNSMIINLESLRGASIMATVTDFHVLPKH